MSDQIVTDEQRTAIEKTIRSLLDEMTAANEELDFDRTRAFASDALDLGFMRSGVLYPSADAYFSSMQDTISRLQGQKIEPIETHVAVVSPSVAILTWLTDCSATFKDGDVWSGRYATTIVFAQVDDQWKIVHSHESFPQEE